MKFFEESHHLRLYYAQKAIDYTLSRIKYSSNLGDNDNSNSLETGEDKTFNKMRSIEITHAPYTFEWINIISDLAEYYSVGNCCEKSCVAFMYLYKKFSRLPIDQRPSLELFNNPFDDHFFVVIGRFNGTERSDPRTWNPGAIICDPWAETKSFAINQIDFDNIEKQTNYVIQSLRSHDLLHPGLILKRDVLAKANQVKDRIVISQECLVLRARFDFLRNQLFCFNQNVPITYEAWDYPKEKHYKKQIDLETKLPF